MEKLARLLEMEPSPKPQFTASGEGIAESRVIEVINRLTTPQAPIE